LYCEQDAVQLHPKQGTYFYTSTKYHRWLITAFDQRQVSDYAFDPNVQSSVVIEMINQAQEFMEAAKVYLDLE